MSSITTDGTRPVALPVIADNIPELLKALAQWLVWRYVADIDPDTGEVDWDKPPLCARGGPASSTNKRTWSDFATACAALATLGVDGIGFALDRKAGDDSPGLVAIDLDDCRDPETGVIEQWALDIVAALDSYTEVSPSGRGVRIFVIGKLPKHGRKKGKFENYEACRYVTVTGQRVEGTPATIEARQEQLLEVHLDVFGPEPPPRKAGPSTPSTLADAEVIEKAGAAKNGEKFKRLWGGDWSEYGSQSEADLALANHLAFWCGPNEERITELFAQSGLCRPKWDRRPDYQRRTIAKALNNRTQFYDPGHYKTGWGYGTSGNGAAGVKGSVKAHPNGDGRSEDAPRGPTEGGGCEEDRPKQEGFANFKVIKQKVKQPDGTEEEAEIRVALSVNALREILVDLTGGWPKRVGNLLFVAGRDHTPQFFTKADELLAWINGGFRGDVNRVQWLKGANKVTQAQFFAHLQQSAENYDAVEAYPHHPPMPRTYYMHPPAVGGDGSALRLLLRRFNPYALEDGDLLLGLVLSLFWGGEPGQRPGWLITSAEGDNAGGRGVGKTKLVLLLSRLVGGCVAAASTDKVGDLITRLLSEEGLGKRVVLHDNVKTHRFSNADLEGLITTDVISGKRLFCGEGRRPNTLTHFITLNGASLSKDLAQRCIPLKLSRPRWDGDWEQGAIDLIESRRWEIIGDALAILKAEAPKIKTCTRWGPWEQAILSRVGDPSNCQVVITDRQGEFDEDAAEADVVRGGFVAELKKREHDPEAEAVWIHSQDVAEIVNTTTGEKRPVNKATAYLRTLAIPELRESRSGKDGRGWLWTGEKATAGAKRVNLNPASVFHTYAGQTAK